MEKRTKILYALVAIVTIAVVVYPVAYSYASNASTPYMCAPLIPCQGPSPGTAACTAVCVVRIANATFIPGTLVVSPGAEVIWVNDDYVSHTSTPFDSSAWGSPVIPPGRSYTAILPTGIAPGDYYYHCNVHPAMIGIIRVASP